MKLIDADALKKSVNDKSTHWLNDWSTIGVLAEVDRQPTIDAVPVVHGRWIEKPYLFGTTRYCSKCGDNYGMPHGVFNFCPNCGTKMDLDELACD